MPQDNSQGGWGDVAGIGLQMAVGVGLGVAVGYWLDKKFDWSPWGVLCGSILGLAAGMYLLLKTALRSNRDD